MLKGIAFVLVTGALLYEAFRRALWRWEREAQERRDAEGRLGQSEERLRLALDASADGLWDWNLRTGTAYMSPRFREITGMPESEPADFESFRRRVRPEDWPALEASMNELVAGKSDHGEAEYRLDCGDGGERWIWGRTTVAQRAADGKAARMIGTISDITQRKAAEIRLADSERRYHQLFQMESDAIMVGDGETHRVVDVNDAAVRLYGYSREELLAMRMEDVSAEQDASRESFGGGSVHVPLRWHRKKNGQVFAVEISVSIIESQGRRLKLGAIRDISERRRNEEAHARLATVVEQATDAIVITNTEGAIVYANPAFERASGYTCAEVVGQNPRVLKSGKQGPEFYREMWEVLGRGETWRGHFINRHKNGRLYEEEATISPVRDHGGRVVSYVAVKRDVTREVQLETQLRQSQKMEAIGQLAGGVAHDFNNILSSMLMQTDLIDLVEGLPDDVREGLKQIRADTKRAADLTRQLLLFGRRQVMQRHTLDLNDVVMNIARMLQRVIGEDVKLQLNVAPGPLMANADRGMLEQVLVNLVVNARDAMRNGGRLTVDTFAASVDEETARMNPDAAPGAYVCISVADTGGGIPADVMPRIFEPFFTTKEAGKGTGLGLATVFGIVKQHGGWIRVDNRQGEGVTFQVYLPAVAVPVGDAATAGAAARPRGGTETILMVEDEPSVRMLTRSILQKQGYTVLEACDGVEALKVWGDRGSGVALLLTDLVMPGGMSGKDLARQLQERQPGLRVVFASGYSTEFGGREIRLLDGESFIQKPYSVETLLSVVRRSLDESGKAGSGAPPRPLS